MPKFRFLLDVASDGAAFEAFGKTERQLFENAASAFAEAVIETKTLRRRAKEQLMFRSATLELLLLGFIERLILLKNAKQFLIKETKLGIYKEGKSWILQGFIYGQRFDPVKHTLKVDVNSIDAHLFEIKKIDKGYRAQVILKGMA